MMDANNEPIAHCSKTTPVPVVRQPSTVIPSPFSRAQDVGLDLILVPTQGKFLDDSQICAKMHCGISSTQGILEFNQRTGLHQTKHDDPYWEQCLPLRVLDPFVASPYYADLQVAWIQTYEYFAANQSQSTKEMLDEQDGNCFDFAIEFLNEFNADTEDCLKLSEAAQEDEKVYFIRRFVHPAARRAYQYISEYHAQKSSSQ